MAGSAERRSRLVPWVLGALAVVVVVWVIVWLTGPTPDLLPHVYSVL